MKIRKATKKDLKEIARLMITEFSKPPFNEKTTLKDVMKSLNFYFKIGQIYVAIIEDRIIGVIVFKLEQYWEGQVIIIEDLAIIKSYHNKGIGNKLMKYVEEYGKKKKISSISFSTNKKSKAVKIYQNKGYKLEKNTIFMRKELKK